MKQIPPSFAWLIPFVPTLLYFVATRLSFSELGETIHLECTVALSEIFPCQGVGTLNLQHIESFRDIQHILWKHDSELGRGYLLISDENRIWRWEVGGGPIAIGTSLFLDQAGCRSKLSALGVGRLAIDFKDHDHASEGRLIVVERGEGRVVRLEENGARTPLLHVVPDHLVLLPNGDLLVSLNNEIIELPAAVHIAPLANLTVSRHAHSWDNVRHSHPVSTIIQDPSIQRISGMATSATTLFIAALYDDHPVILSKSILEEGPLQVHFNLTRAGMKKAIGELALADSGKLFVVSDKAIVILDDSSFITTLDVPERIISICLGGDGYLYISSQRRLYRLRTKEKPLRLPTDRVVKASIRLS